MELNLPELQNILESIAEKVMGYLPRLAYALITFLIGLWVIRVIRKIMLTVLDRYDMDRSLETFIASLTSITLQILLVVSVVGMLGVQMSSFIALLASAGIAIGMALAGTLQNFTSGMMILMFKPFKVGDYIDAQGFGGTVDEIQVFHTILKTPDNKTVILGNAQLVGGSIVNYSKERKRRLDFTIGIGYEDNIDVAKRALMSILTKDERVLDNPEPVIAVTELADSSVNVTARFWVKKADYWPVKDAMLETIKKTFDKKGISIPYPQRDIHMYQMKK